MIGAFNKLLVLFVKKTARYSVSNGSKFPSLIAQSVNLHNSLEEAVSLITERNSLLQRQLHCCSSQIKVMSVKRRQKLHFTFGIIADVQYADAPDGFNFAGTSKRYYRGALDKLRQAITSWQSDNDQNVRPSFILQMGDALDGVNKRLGCSESSLKSVLDVFSTLTMPLYHVWGNHEYYNFTPAQLLKTALYSGNLKNSTPVPNKVYYSAVPHPRFKIIALDTYEVSLLASVEGSDEYKKAKRYLAVNKNKDQNSGLGLEGPDKRFKKFNGGLAESQIEWMEMCLREAEEMEQNVIIIGHCALYEPAADYDTMCYNAPEVMAALHRHSHCILGYLCGHDHAGGYSIDKQGIHHLTLPGVLENDKDSDFGTVYVYGDWMELRGNGRVPDLQIPLRYKLEDGGEWEPDKLESSKGRESTDKDIDVLVERKTEVSCSSYL